jgi:hypothetical protein
MASPVTDAARRAVRCGAGRGWAPKDGQGLPRHAMTQPLRPDTRGQWLPAAETWRVLAGSPGRTAKAVARRALS